MISSGTEVYTEVVLSYVRLILPKWFCDASVKSDVFLLFFLQPLDFETKKAYTFKVEASNQHLDHRFHSVGPFKDTATVKINVLDMDEPPVFSKPMYTMEVYEDTPVGTIIGAVTAQDLDAGSSSVR